MTKSLWMRCTYGMCENSGWSTAFSSPCADLNPMVSTVCLYHLENRHVTGFWSESELPECRFKVQLREVHLVRKFGFDVLLFGDGKV